MQSKSFLQEHVYDIDILNLDLALLVHFPGAQVLSLQALSGPGISVSLLVIFNKFNRVRPQESRRTFHDSSHCVNRVNRAPLAVAAGGRHSALL